MPFDFQKLLAAASGATVQKWSGYPPFHFVGGNIDEDTIHSTQLAEAVKQVLTVEGRSMAKYGMESGPQGYEPLRQFIAANLLKRAGMSVGPDEVLLTTGSLQALDLVNELFLEPGDAVIVEAANYAGTLSRLERIGAEAVPVELDNGGMRMDCLRQVLAELAAQDRRPKFIYTIPTIQNPTGTVMGEDRRKELLAIAAGNDLPVFEDDCYADLIFDGRRPPAIHALDPDGRVIYCGTFSKTVAPALRVGYLVAPWPLMGHILPLKTDAGSGALEQMVLAHYLPENFERHVKDLLPVLRRKAEVICAALDEHFGAAAEYSRPVGGIYVWITLPEHVDTNRLANIAGKAGIAINAGPQWTVNGEENRNRMRLCFGHPGEDTIREGIARLAEICHAEFGVPVRSANIPRDGIRP